MLNLNDGFGVPNSPTVAERPETALSSGRRANWQKTRFDPILALASIHDECKYCPTPAVRNPRRARLSW